MNVNDCTAIEGADEVECRAGTCHGEYDYIRRILPPFAQSIACEIAGLTFSRLVRAGLVGQLAQHRVRARLYPREPVSRVVSE